MNGNNGLNENEGNDSELIEFRKEKISEYFKKGKSWVLILLLVALILGVYIRSLPITDHNGRPGLWDVTTNSWTLGPDLDPWLFLRNAKTIVEDGELPERDMMRSVPIGFDNTKESQLLPYLIAWTYYSLKYLGISSDITYAAVIFPVIMFGLTVISFFLFVREVFARKSKKSKFKANIIALVSTFLMIVVPVFLSRTIAGIPEKESASFFFMFLAFYLFLKSWKSDKSLSIILFSILSGFSTAVMGLIWGGVLYIFIPISFATLIAFILNKVNLKEFYVFSIWVFVSYGLMVIFPSRYTIKGLITSLSSSLAFFVLILILVHIILLRLNIKILDNKKIPRNIISLIITIILLVFLATVFFGPNFILDKLNAIHQTLFKPIHGRWGITVAENRQPYFDEWRGNFGPFIKNIPIMFWLFIAGSILLFRKMILKIKSKDGWVLTGLYVFFLAGLIFSRYSSSSLFNGENFVSKLFYYLSALLLAVFLIYYYIQYYNKGDKSFEDIRYEYLLLLILFLLTLFTARGAIRLIMVLAPVATIFIGFLIVEVIDKFIKSKDETKRVFLGIIILIVLISSIFTFWAFYNSTKSQAYGFVPSSYNYQWQHSMNWVRNNVDKNAVFAHWWDYGYWVQSIGERASILDGGNPIAYWNYLMGRYVLTGDNQDQALEFLYNHNGTHLLIDSSDIGKYTAFSSIGSDIDYDRYSWFGTFLRDDKQTQETSNQLLNFYGGGIGLDEDIVINNNGNDLLLPRQSAGVGAIIIPTLNSVNNSQINFGQPYVIFIYQNQQYRSNLRYLYFNEKLYDFETGIEGAAYLMPRLSQQGQGLNNDNIGAVLFISPRLFRGLLSQIYIMNDPLGKFSRFKLVNTQQNLLIESLESQGLNLPDFVYFNGVQGPIKIWEIEYTGKEQIKDEYIDTNYRNWIDWEL